MSIDYTNYQPRVIADNDLTLVAEYDCGDNHDWNIMEIYYQEATNRFFWLSDSGCSCHWLWEGIHSIDLLENGLKADVLNALRTFSGKGWGKSGTIETVAKIMSL